VFVTGGSRGEHDERHPHPAQWGVRTAMIRKEMGSGDSTSHESNPHFLYLRRLRRRSLGSFCKRLPWELLAVDIELTIFCPSEELAPFIDRILQGRPAGTLRIPDGYK
jgi:hypothetical protein